jgi:hypothetical protein
MSWLSRGCHDVRATVRFILPLEEMCVVGKVFRFNHKIMIKVQESPPCVMVDKNLWSTRVWIRD